MHFVAALDRVEGMRCVLALFEGVATGAADGYARMAEKPAATLLHLGPGLANGLANLHNASEGLDAGGQHRRRSRDLSPPVRCAADLRHRDRRAAVLRLGAHLARREARRRGRRRCDRRRHDAARPGRDPDPAGRHRLGRRHRARPSCRRSRNARVSAKTPSRKPRACCAPASRRCCCSPGPRCARRASSSRRASRRRPARSCWRRPSTAAWSAARGASRSSAFPIRSIRRSSVLAGLKHIVLVGSRVPVAFFAYPDKPSKLAPEDCQFTTLARAEEDLRARARMARRRARRRGAADRAFDSSRRPRSRAARSNAADASRSRSARLIPENAIVVDEGVSTGRGFFPATRNAHPHTWLQNMGGSIGIGMPLATGAAVACPDRKVLNLQADGSAMYTIQSLWTQARENLDITTVLLEQPLLRDPAPRAHQCRRAECRPQGARHARSLASRSRLRRAGARHGRAGRARRQRWTSSTRRSRAASRRPGPIWSKRCWSDAVAALS